VHLSGDTMVDTSAAAVACMTNHSMLGIVIGNLGHINQLLSYSLCPNSSACLQSKSWCFWCLSFMDEREISIFSERIFDCMHWFWNLDYECVVNEEKCPLRQHLSGDDCWQCSDRTNYNNQLTSRLTNDTLIGLIPSIYPVLLESIQQRIYMLKVMTASNANVVPISLMRKEVAV
jgi:hypothetical protein